MRIGSIDVGTNTLLLLIVDIDTHGHLDVVHHEQRLPRLGRNVDQNRNIHVSAFDRIAWILQEYINLSIQHRVDRTVACATSAVRDAGNREEFLSYIERTTGLRPEVLTGEEEAILTYRGAISGISGTTNDVCVLDIGGGSTELVYPSRSAQNGGTALHQHSLEIGSVRLTERYFKHDPPLSGEVASARQFILEELSPIRNPGFERYKLVGVAGTSTTLACLDLGLEEFDLEKVSSYRMKRGRVREWSDRLLRMPTRDIHSMSDATEGRADILAAGLLILSEIMELYRFSSLMVSERGLRYGLAIREWEKNRPT